MFQCYSVTALQRFKGYRVDGYKHWNFEPLILFFIIKWGLSTASLGQSQVGLLDKAMVFGKTNNYILHTNLLQI